MPNRLFLALPLSLICLSHFAFGNEPLAARVKVQSYVFNAKSPALNGKSLIVEPVKSNTPAAFGYTAAYAGKTLTLDGSGSTAGDGVSYQWTVAGEDARGLTIEDADKAVAHVTPKVFGLYKFALAVSRGAEHQQAGIEARIFQDPEASYPDYEGTTKIAYKLAVDPLGGLHKMPLYVTYPPFWTASDKRGAILLFHGGAWSRGDASRYISECWYYASRGMVAMDVEYRTGYREGTSASECVADAKSAVRYVRSHAKELGIDPQKIAVGGESAGAHLAACTGTVPEYNEASDDLSVSCVPNALLLYFPFAMVTTEGNRKDDMAPLHFVGAGTPPTLYIAGEMDSIAPAVRGIQWGEKAKAANRPFRLFIYRKAHHPSGNHDIMKPGIDNDMVRQTDLFLGSLGFVDGPPTIPPLDATWTPEKLYVEPKDFHAPADRDPKNPK